MSFLSSSSVSSLEISADVQNNQLLPGGFNLTKDSSEHAVAVSGHTYDFLADSKLMHQSDFTQSQFTAKSPANFNPQKSAHRFEYPRMSLEGSPNNNKNSFTNESFDM